MRCEPRGCSRRAGAAPILAAALLAAGCALAPKFETPQLSIVGVELVKSDLWEQRLKVRMRVQNPNKRALPVKAIAYTLEVEGQQLASGQSAASFVVPASGEAEFDMNVTTNLAGTLIKLLGRGSEAMQSVPYRLSGTLSLSAGWLRSIPFEQQGTFRLQ
jgi:LEA14-like dessication related protein